MTAKEILVVWDAAVSAYRVGWDRTAENLLAELYVLGGVRLVHPEEVGKGGPR